jgi:hypothetical protein
MAAQAMPASRFLASDYIRAALTAGFAVRACVEPSWGDKPGAGGPFAQYYCAEAASAAYRDTPAAIIWHFQRGG